MAILTLSELHEAIDQFGVEVVVNHLNNVSDPATVCLLAEQLDCTVDGSAIVQAAIDAQQGTAQPAPTKAKARIWHGSRWIRPDKRLAIYLRDSFLCVYCGKNLATVRAKLRTLDHVIPVALGGTNEADNLVTCCKRCNDSKGDRTGYEYLARDVKPGQDNTTFVQRKNRLTVLLSTPLNRDLAKEILAGTLDLSDCIAQSREQV